MKLFTAVVTPHPWEAVRTALEGMAVSQVWVWPVENVVRVRTGDRDQSAV